MRFLCKKWATWHTKWWFAHSTSITKSLKSILNAPCHPKPFTKLSASTTWRSSGRWWTVTTLINARVSRATNKGWAFESRLNMIKMATTHLTLHAIQPALRRKNSELKIMIAILKPQTSITANSMKMSLKKIKRFSMTTSSPRYQSSEASHAALRLLGLTFSKASRWTNPVRLPIRRR